MTKNPAERLKELFSGSTVDVIETDFREVVFRFDNGKVLRLEATGYEGTRLEVKVIHKKRVVKMEDHCEEIEL